MEIHYKAAEMDILPTLILPFLFGDQVLNIRSLFAAAAVGGHSGCFIYDHMHGMPMPKECGLHASERVDVHQAYSAPPMSSLLGLPCPVNLVGRLPLDYIDMKKKPRSQLH